MRSAVPSLDQRSATINPVLSISSRHFARISALLITAIGISSITNGSICVQNFTYSISDQGLTNWISSQSFQSALSISPETQHCRSAVTVSTEIQHPAFDQHSRTRPVLALAGPSVVSLWASSGPVLHSLWNCHRDKLPRPTPLHNSHSSLPHSQSRVWERLEK